MKKSVSLRSLEELCTSGSSCDSSACTHCRVFSTDSLDSTLESSRRLKASLDQLQCQWVEDGSNSSSLVSDGATSDVVGPSTAGPAGCEADASPGLTARDLSMKVFECAWLDEPEIDDGLSSAWGEDQCHLGTRTVHQLAGGGVVSDLAFRHDGTLLASAGVSKQIHLLRLDEEALDQGLGSFAGRRPSGSGGRGLDDTLLRTQHVLPMTSKLSSVAWSPFNERHIMTADYDGSLFQMDVETGHWLMEGDDHHGRRIWACRYSPLIQSLAATAGDDGAVKLWMGTQERAVAELRPSGSCPVTSVEFCPRDGTSVAMSCADSRAYIYDLRYFSAPLLVAAGHERSVSYVRWLGRGRLVTAATDSTVRVWDVGGGAHVDWGGAYAEAGWHWQRRHSVGQAPAEEGVRRRARTSGGYSISGVLRSEAATVFSAHSNPRRFVGLSVREDGLIASGCETGAVYVYSPVQQGGGLGRGSGNYAGEGPVSTTAVAWRPDRGEQGSALLMVANAVGEVQALEVQRH